MWLPFHTSPRHRQPEVMDQPGLDEPRHRQALRGLERINFWSASARILWPPLRAFFRQEGATSLRLLDFASGAGDVPLRLWQRARRAGLDLRMEGCDRSPFAVSYAQRRAAQQGAPIRFFEWDVLGEPLRASYDVVTCSLFLHHLDAEEAIELLRRMAGLGRLLLVNDLRRCFSGLVLAHVGTRLLSRSRVVHVDGPLSVKAAFTRQEVLQLARRAGLEGVTVERRWPCRFLLTWRRPGGMGLVGDQGRG
jgi:2-polyprenyl-3-methyl-5-hydroxy-6-metoxy-1,4-benzoquinol methylase